MTSAAAAAGGGGGGGALFTVVGPTVSRQLSIRSQIMNRKHHPLKLCRFPSTLTSNIVPFHTLLLLVPSHKLNSSPNITCSASDKPSSSEISSTAKIRSEVLSPFRSVRMFFYVAFIASGALGGFIAATQLLGALANPARAGQVPEIAQGLGIDIAAVSLFAFLYWRENNAKNAQLARLSREESLSGLKLRVDENKVISIGQLRGFARLVICAGPGSHVSEAFRQSLDFADWLLERGVVVVPLVTDGNSPSFKFADNGEQTGEVGDKRKRLWQLTPVYVSEWSK